MKFWYARNSSTGFRTEYSLWKIKPKLKHTCWIGTPNENNGQNWLVKNFLHMPLKPGKIIQVEIKPVRKKR